MAAAWVAAQALVGSLAWELPYAVGVAIKKKKKKKPVSLKKNIKEIIVQVGGYCKSYLKYWNFGKPTIC